MNDQQRKLDRGSLFTGLVLIAIGTAFLLDHMGVIDFHMVLSDYWPMLLVFFGVTRFVNRRKHSWSGVWLIVIGLWLQATTLHWWGMTFESSWPLLLIAFGAVTVVRALVHVSNGPEARDDD